MKPITNKSWYGLMIGAIALALPLAANRNKSQNSGVADTRTAQTGRWIRGEFYP